MLLPGTLSHSRVANATSDIRKNLRLRDPEKYPQYDPKKTLFILKSAIKYWDKMEIYDIYLKQLFVMQKWVLKEKYGKPPNISTE
ncbi:hypothetical protein WA026_002503 [Henosepilachna vigintioctopunctata]|uniref:Uncharacterized protein n=1 Tax=Henosepilachna vigintioctopunctata TaxID=420089 RepID=A0AAW1TV33_9CUCU